MGKQQELGDSLTSAFGMGVLAGRVAVALPAVLAIVQRNETDKPVRRQRARRGPSATPMPVVWGNWTAPID